MKSKKKSAPRGKRFVIGKKGADDRRVEPPPTNEGLRQSWEPLRTKPDLLPVDSRRL
jgi:hypothetical protein